MNQQTPKSPNFPDCFYRVSVKGLFVKDEKILLFKESQNESGNWELPGGGLDFGEDIFEGLKREIQEESGLKVTHIEKRPIYILPCRFDKRRGMDWHYSLVLCYKIELENLDFTQSDECEQIGFFSKEELNSLNLEPQTEILKTYFNPKDF